MPRITACPGCGTKHNTSRLAVGARFRCTRCERVVPVPADSDPSLTPSHVKETTETTTTPPGGGEEDGRVIGNCRLIRRLGRGGMGVVYLAQHLRLDCPVALKLLPAELAEKDASFIERFVKEARLAAKLRHPQVVQVLDVAEDEGVHYIIQEYVDGGTAGDLLEGGRTVSEAQLWRILASVAAALEAAAELKIVHRDIKPDNIMLTTRGTVKLADLGLAKQQQSGDVSLTMGGMPLGTPLYMPPEQTRDARSADSRSDIYSLGATLYHLAVGRPPFEGENAFDVMMKHATESPVPPRQLRRDLSERLSALILKMMAKEPGGRPQTPAEIIAAAREGVGEASKSSRAEELAAEARKAAAKVRSTATAYVFKPMSDEDRKIVHRALVGQPGIRPASEGRGDWRRVVIYPEPE